MSKKNKKWVVFFISIGAVLYSSLFLDASNKPNYEPVLVGTFLCKELPFASLTFDYTDNRKVYYEDYEIREEGKYTEEGNSTFVINSNTFQDIKILYESDKFFITINGKEYLFTKFSHVPIINCTNYEEANDQ